MKNDMCNGWCTPLKVYIAFMIISVLLSIVRFIFYNNDGNNMVILSVAHILGIFIWSSVLYMLCKKCYLKTAWAVLFLPVIVGFTAFFIGIIAHANVKKN